MLRFVIIKLVINLLGVNLINLLHALLPYNNILIIYRE